MIKSRGKCENHAVYTVLRDIMRFSAILRYFAVLCSIKWMALFAPPPGMPKEYHRVISDVALDVGLGGNHCGAVWSTPSDTLWLPSQRPSAEVHPSWGFLLGIPPVLSPRLLTTAVPDSIPESPCALHFAFTPETRPQKLYDHNKHPTARFLGQKTGSPCHCWIGCLRTIPRVLWWPTITCDGPSSKFLNRPEPV